MDKQKDIGRLIRTTVSDLGSDWSLDIRTEVVEPQATDDEIRHVHDAGGNHHSFIKVLRSFHI